jgi:hypothetical protein
VILMSGLVDGKSRPGVDVVGLMLPVEGVV